MTTDIKPNVSRVVMGPSGPVRIPFPCMSCASEALYGNIYGGFFCLEHWLERWSKTQNNNVYLEQQ